MYCNTVHGGLYVRPMIPCGGSQPRRLSEGPAVLLRGHVHVRVQIWKQEGLPGGGTKNKIFLDSLDPSIPPTKMHEALPLILNFWVRRGRVRSDIR